MANETAAEKSSREMRERNARELEAAAAKDKKEADEAAELAELERIEAAANKIKGHKLYDIKNPLRAQRTIYDGIEGSMAAHTVAPGGTKRGVKLHADIVKEMADRNQARPDSDLIITPYAEKAAD